MPFDPELTKIFGDDFTSIFESAMSKMDDSASLIMQQGLSNAVFDARKFGVEIQQRVAGLQAQGLASSEIKKLIDRDLKEAGRIFGSLKNSTKETLSNGINQSGRAGQFEAYKPTDLLAWVTVGGHKVCPDCGSRAGEVHTVAEWETLGLPGTGWSVCRGYCYCILDPSGKIDREVKLPEKKVKAIKPEKGSTIRPKKPPSVSDAIMAGKHTNIPDTELWLRDNVLIGRGSVDLKGISLETRNRLNKLFQTHIDAGHRFSYESVRSYYSKSSVVARSSTRRLSLNRFHLGGKKIAKYERTTAQRCVDTGWWANGGNTFESIMTHEMGHGLTLGHVTSNSSGTAIHTITKTGEKLKALWGEYAKDMRDRMNEFMKGKTFDEVRKIKAGFDKRVYTDVPIEGWTGFKTVVTGTNDMAGYYKLVYGGEYISDYAQTNIMEWIAESFMNANMSLNPSSYALRVREIMLEWEKQSLTMGRIKYPDWYVG